MPSQLLSGPISTGPSSAPTLPQVMAMPRVAPRRTGGVPLDSQARPAVQEMAEAVPWPPRAASNIQKLWANA
jgi:hypothetical protein